MTIISAINVTKRPKPAAFAFQRANWRKDSLLARQYYSAFLGIFLLLFLYGLYDLVDFFLIACMI